MKWILGGIVALIVALVTIALVGLCLPAEHVATRSAIYHQTPEIVFAVLTDFEAAPRWRSDLYKVVPMPARHGKPVIRELGEHGAQTLEVAEILAPRRLVLRILDTSGPLTGTWTYDLAPVPGGTRVTLTERGELRNPVFRFVGRFVLGHTRTIDAALRSLGRAFGQTVLPE